MHSPADIARLRGVFELQADAASRRMRDVDAARNAAQQRGAELKQEHDALLPVLRLSVAYGLDRATLFERLRGVAVARAHALECRLQVDVIEEDIAAMAVEHAQHRAERDAHASRARRLEEVGRRQSRRNHARALRRVDIDTQESYACR